MLFQKSMLSSIVTKNYKYFLWLLPMQLYVWVGGMQKFAAHYASFKTFIFLWCIPFIPVCISIVGFYILKGIGSGVWVGFFFGEGRQYFIFPTSKLFLL